MSRAPGEAEAGRAPSATCRLCGAGSDTVHGNGGASDVCQYAERGTCSAAMILAPATGLYATHPFIALLSGGILKLLLTSGGVTNASIRGALVDLLGKPIADSTALCIPTAQYGHPWVGPGVRAWQFISGNSDNPMVDLGWQSVGVLELTALPSIDEERWVPLVRETDVLLAAGGDVLYLCHWMRESGLADLLPSLSETVWVGLSAGSMVMTPEVGDDFIQWRPPAGDDSTLGVVGFSICPHLAQDGMPGNSMAEAEQWAAGISGPAYAMDDETAIKVADGTVEVVSEGHWKLFS